MSIKENVFGGGCIYYTYGVNVKEGRPKIIVKSILRQSDYKINPYPYIRYCS